MSAQQTKLEAARRQVAEYLSTAQAMRSDEDARLAYLERAVETQREAARLAAEIKDALAPCRLCGRKVASPCNDAGGYYEGGPWDFACEGFVNGHGR